VEAGGFSAAAKRLDLDTPVVSKRVAKLEQALGVRLLSRTSRKVTPTEAGIELHEHCGRIIEQVEAAQAAVGRLRANPGGRLRVTAPTEFSEYRIAPLLPEFFRRYPEISLELAATDRVADLVDERFDLGLRIQRTPPPTYAVRKLCDVHPVACAAPAYLRRAGRPRTPADLAEHNCLTIPEAVSQGVWKFTKGDQDHTTRIRGNYYSISSNTLRALAVAGVGIAFIPDYVASADLASGRLEQVLCDFEPERDLAVYAVYPARSFVAPRLRAFIDFIAERLQPPASRPTAPPAPAPRSRSPRRAAAR